MTARNMTVALIAATLLVGAAPAQGAENVKLLRGVSAYPYPGGGKAIARVPATAPLTGAPMVLPVIARAQANGRPWVRVRLPQRPNGSTGWIAADGTHKLRNPWTVRVDTGQRRAVVQRAGKVVKRLSVVVGTSSTPTPVGSFFVVERVRQPYGAAIGPWVLATSAYSNVLQEFAGGPGQIGLHGRTGLPDPLGSAASHGCVRFTDSAIRWMARRLPPGTAVKITR